MNHEGPTLLATVRATAAGLRLGDLRLAPRLAWALSVALRQRGRASLPELVRRLESGGPAGARRPRPEDADRITYLTNSVLRALYRRDFCYPRALALFHFLSRWGLPVQFVLGVQRVGEALRGHAWVEVDGRPFGEADDPRRSYHVTYTYPTQPTGTP
jgi:hypothetical protein